ncbi:class I SAM-dependent methyltransferase [Funiculus sociatus GB2-A5]|uniref:Class I SAM-dependent methyltransferase n=1 Tax=Funiculus sociatus GB2-A5 TaxID=2933946 RepID=A0ABV0JQF7_9CYAN|nr:MULTISPECIES: methyltransferase domain-containing protein [unclassified Trichocoleus]MBD1906678.1 methyltransferase domain-containing protein [Trichocoleus sp. FACHB-832]MBD2063115.1 methyltransferase domain-containing protein [Trichocoleus sp. FACHB-6]
MFFPELIKSIKPSDRVLEIGPGGNPHPRADILLEYEFDSPDMAEAQRGYVYPLKTDKKIIYYKGDRFPFKNKEFDYIICSHVIEHINNVDEFVREINRVGKAGYLEYPTIYYDYIYNFPEHLTFVKYKNGKLFWMNKSQTSISSFQPVHHLFYETLRQEYFGLINDLKFCFFEGFEWSGNLDSVKTSNLNDLVFNILDIPPKPLSGSRISIIKTRFRNLLNKILNI